MSERPAALVELDDVHRTYPGGVAAVRGVLLRRCELTITVGLPQLDGVAVTIRDDRWIASR